MWRHVALFQKITEMHMMMIEDKEVTDGSVLVQMHGCKSRGICEGNDVRGYYIPLGSVGRRLAAPRRSPPTLVFFVVAFAVLIWNCGYMRLLLLGRIELPQLTEACGECPEEIILRPRVSQQCKFPIVGRTLTARSLAPDILDCSRCLFFSLN